MKKTVLLSALASMVVTSYAADNSLQSQIDELKNKLEMLQKAQTESQNELESRVDSVETATMVNKINWGVDFRTRVDAYHRELANGSKSSDGNIWSNRLRLNMSSDISDDMKFTGRLVMYKNWSDTGADYIYGGMDPMQGRRPSDTTLFVDRAYVDWLVLNGNVPLTLTIGRQPSSDGPSHQFKDNTVRKATYSALSFDGGADGIVATLGLKKLIGLPESALRIGYGKGYQDGSGSSYIGNGGIKDTNVLGAFLDFGLGIPGSLVQLSAVQATGVYSPAYDTNLGDVMLYTSMIELTNVADSGLDLFAHYAMSVAKPNGQAGIMGGLLSNAPSTTDKDGNAYWVGGRYTLKSDTLNHPRIGLEYNHGSENWFSFTQGSNDVVNKLATRGNALEAYYIQPINRYAHLRMGAQRINYDYTLSGMQVGTPSAVTGNDLSKLTNYYLLFNVNY